MGLDVYIVATLPYLWRSVISAQAQVNTLIFTVVFYALSWTVHEIIYYVQELVFFPILNNTIRSLQFKVVNHVHHVAYLQAQNLAMAKVFGAIKRISLATRNFLRINLLLILPCFLKLFVGGWNISQETSYGLFFFAGLLIFIVMAGFLIPWYGAIRQKAWQITDDVGNVISHSLLQTQMIRDTMQDEQKKLAHIMDQELRIWHKTNWGMNGIHIVLGLAIAFIVMAPVIMMTWDLTWAKATQDSLIILQGQLLLLAVPLRSLILELRQLMESCIDLQKIRDIFALKPFSKAEGAICQHAKSEKLFEIRNLDFGFSANRPLFHADHLQILRGQKILIQGESGVGKTMLLNLLSGRVLPPLGAFFMRAEDMSQLYIPQNVPLANGSIAQNICDGLGFQPSHTQLQSVLKICELTELVESLEQGLDTKVGDLGFKLSGGERQRVLLARALLMKPDVLMLDEAMDSIDLRRRTLLYKKIWDTIPTVIWTSHHTEAAEYATDVWTLQDGIVTLSSPDDFYESLDAKTPSLVGQKS